MKDNDNNICQLYIFDFAALFSTQVSVSVDIAIGKAKAAACTFYNGFRGIASTPNSQNLAAQSEPYLISAFMPYRDNNQTTCIAYIVQM